MDNTKTVSVLNDLLNITNDRIQGFSKVEDKVWDHYPVLRTDYDEMVSESLNMKNELSDLITERGGDPDNTGSAAGSIHRAWIDVKNAFAGDNASASLGNVVYGEKAAIDAYQDALDSGNLCSESTHVVLDQLQNLKASYHKFKNLEELKN